MQADDDAVSLEPVDQAGMMLSCLTLSPRPPSPLPPGSYFKALGEVDRAERTSDTLVLSGPDVTLAFELQHPVGRR